MKIASQKAIDGSWGVHWRVQRLRKGLVFATTFRLTDAGTELARRKKDIS
jgi:hypothetical protein